MRTSPRNTATICLVALLAGLGAAPAAHAASDAERIAQLEKMMLAMQQEIESLKKNNAREVPSIATPATTASTTSTPTAGTAAAAPAPAGAATGVVAGDLPGSFRAPGTETSIRIYGAAELQAIHESKGDGSKNDFSTFVAYAPLRGSPEAQRQGQTYLHARASRIGIEASTPSSLGPVTGKVEGDFSNDPRTGNSAVYGTLGNIYTQQATNSYGFRLRHAYLTLGPWMFGQSWSTFMDVDNTPETVDFNGPIGSTFIRQPQIRYTHSTPNHGSFIAALENSVSYVLDESGAATPAGFSRVPDLVLRWDKPLPWGSLSLRAVSHEHRVNDGAGISASRRGTGFAASGQVRTVGEDFVSWIVTGGDGIGRYFNYIEGAGYDRSTDRIVTEKAFGVVLGYQRKLSDTFRMNFVYGMQRSLQNEYSDWARANGLDQSRVMGNYALNRSISQLHIGGIWNPVKMVDVGLEYIRGQRETLGDQKGDMSRINFMARYSLN